MNESPRSHYNILDYLVCDDYIVYPSVLPTNNSRITNQNIGIFILELRRWDLYLEILNELYRYSLIDSFSIQINIKWEIQVYLILKIVGYGSNELKFRYYNLKKRLQEKFKDTHLLAHKKLESTYLSILGLIDHSYLKNLQIHRDKGKFSYCNQEATCLFYYLFPLNVIWMSQNRTRIKVLAELLQAANIPCFLVLYSKNLGDSSQNNYYLFGHTPNPSRFTTQINEKMLQSGYTTDLKNIFHPYCLGKILLRGPIDSKYLHHTKFPPTLNSDLNFSRIDPENTPSLDELLQDIPYICKSGGCYSLFGGDMMLFTVKKLNLASIRTISKHLTEGFQQCVIYFEREEDYDIFIKKLEKSENSQNTIVLFQISELKKVLEALKHKYKSNIAVY